MKRLAAVLLTLLLSAPVWAQRNQTIPKLYCSERLRLPNVTSCPSTDPVPKEGEICWDSDDDALKVWNGSSYTSVSTPTGSFAVNTGDTFSGANSFTGTLTLTANELVIGTGSSTDWTVFRVDRATTDYDLEWDESASAFEFDFGGGLDNGEDVQITDTQLKAPLLVVGGNDATEDITITFDDDVNDPVLTWDYSATQFEFDFDASLNDKADVTISSSLLQAPAITLGIGTASDVALTFDNDDADPAITWDDDANVLAISGAGLKLATCTSAAADPITVDACSVWTPTGATTPVQTINTCGTAQEGRILYILCGAYIGTFDDTGGNLQLAGDFTCTSNATLMLICEGSTGDWLELSRSTNG